MNRLSFVMKSRGFKNSLERVVSVGRRFGFRDIPFIHQLDRFSNIVQEFGSSPSFPISTVLLVRYPHLASQLKNIKADFLSHGYTHVDYAKLSARNQDRLIRKSRNLLIETKQSVSGFRAPYLHWNETLLKTVRKAGFRFDSSAVAWWPLGPQIRLTAEQQVEYKRAQQFYEPFACEPDSNGMPYLRPEGLLEIPVSLPDDEILIDRLHISESAALLEVWKSMLNRSYLSETLFNLQLHPERILVMERPLRAILQSAAERKPGIWITTLNEIDDWCRQKSSIGISWVRRKNKITVEFSNSRRHTILIQNPTPLTNCMPWSKSLWKITDRTIEFSGPRVPVIGLPAGDLTLAPLLDRLGYQYDNGGHEAFSLHLSRNMSRQDVLQAIQNCPDPLLRVGAWPDGNRSALCVSGDIDCATVQDFIWRFIERN